MPSCFSEIRVTEIIKSEMNKQSTIEFIICKRLEEMSLKRCLEKQQLKTKTKATFFVCSTCPIHEVVRGMP